ncbi:MAG: leucyl/phenylalanyl-tRNA--protein transferase [Bacteroidota bacterium]|nr:leucyl/phenylalanyl-tRNA--protein transferase [Bacteroidota bacterium]
MPQFLPKNNNDFPPVDSADEDGLLAFGSNFKIETLLKAYSRGIFPWFKEGELIYWYSPDPRFVLFPEKLKVSHSMRNVFNKNLFKFSMDKAFPLVIKNCRMAKRKDDPGSWITDSFENAYNNLFLQGYAHSAEAWQNNELVGGLYGVLIGKVFFGESMFSKKSNASKFAFIKWCEVLKKNGIELIDCQVYSDHLESLGAELISRKAFTLLLGKLIV